VANIRLIRADGLMLYDHSIPENVGLPYPSRHHYGHRSALEGKAYSVVEVEGGQRLMEAYLPIKRHDTGEVVAVLELYDDVSRFEGQVRAALYEAMLFPTIVFAIFSIVLFSIVARADRIITSDTNLIVATRRNMERYLSRSAVEAIHKSAVEEDDYLHGERESLVILFTDIRGFTTYSETTDPENVVQTLNRLLKIQADIIHRHGGIIDKFIGDQVMATFPAGREEAAVHAAMDILEAVHSQSEPDLKVGLGVHTGEAVVGSMGTPDRRDYTAIGDTINLGARICGACPPGWVYVSEAAFQTLPPELQSRFSDSGTLVVKGRTEPLEIHPFTFADDGGSGRQS